MPSPAAGVALREGPGGLARPGEYLDSVVGWLDGPEAMGTGHGELEERLLAASREQYRLLPQGHLDERAGRETRRDGVTGGDGVGRPRVDNGHQRELTSVLGPVTVTRKAYGPFRQRLPSGRGGRPGLDAGHEARQRPGPGAGSRAGQIPAGCPVTGRTSAATGLVAGRASGNLHPADAVVNLPLVRPSAGLARLAAIEAGRGSFDGAREAIERATGVALGKRQVEDLARHAAVDVEAFYAARQPEPCPDRVLGLQCDGKGIVMRPGHLRPGTAEAAAKAAGKLATRLSPGEKHGRKRMAELVAVYDVDPQTRTTEDIIPTRTTSPQGTAKKRRPGPVVTGRWLAASVTDDIPAVIARMFDEAERRDPRHARTWVALVDGNRQQIDTIRAQAATRGATVSIVIDFVHMIEYVSKPAWTFFYPGDPDAETCVAARARTILAGRAIDTAATIKHQADTAGFRGSERTVADEVTSQTPC